MKNIYVINLSDRVRSSTLGTLGVLCFDHYENDSFFGMIFPSDTECKRDLLDRIESVFQSEKTVDTVLTSLLDTIKWCDVTDLSLFRVNTSSIVRELSDRNRDVKLREIIYDISVEEVYESGE